MNRLKFLLYLILICQSQASFANKSVIIKYSVNDCLFCNMQLQSFQAIAKAYATTVVFKSEYKDQSLEVKEQINEMGIKMSFSDSLYYAYDSSERSMLYILEGNTPVVNEYLKTVDMSKVRIALNDKGTIAGHIKFPNLTVLRTSGKYIYLSGAGTNYIARVNKENLNEVQDTIRVFNKEIKKEIFKSYYGSSFKQKIDSFEKLSKLYRVPNTFNIADFQVCGDSMFVLAMTNAIELIDSSHMRIKNLPFIMLVIDKQVRSILPVNYHTEAGDKANQKLAYHFSPIFFFFDNGSFFISLGKDSLTSSNSLFARATMRSGSLSIDKILPYDLPPFLVTNKVGYMMEDKMYSNGIVSNIYSPAFYSLKDSQTFNLMDMDKTDSSDFTLKDAMDLKIKINFRIVGFNYSNSRLNVIYKRNGSLFYATYTITGKEPELIKETTLTTSFPDSNYSYAIICDDMGFYNYDYKNYRFVRYSY